MGDGSRKTVWLRVWCDGSADPDRGRIAWACVSSGIEDHGAAGEDDPTVAFGVRLTKTTSMVAEVVAMAAAVKLGGRIAEAIAREDPGLDVRLHLVGDCQSLIDGIRENRRPRGLPENIWDIVRQARRDGATLTHLPRRSTKELAFVDTLAHTALNGRKAAAAVAKRSALESTLVRSLEITEEEAARYQAALDTLLPPAATARPVVARDFALQVGRRADGRACVARTVGTRPVVGKESALPRVEEALRALDEQVGLESGEWLRPAYVRAGRRWSWAFEPLDAAVPDAAPAPQP